jgi:hypothetical protein
VSYPSTKNCSGPVGQFTEEFSWCTVPHDSLRYTQRQNLESGLQNL